MSLLPSSIWTKLPGGITIPKGFNAAGIKSGLKSSGNLDLALLLAPKGSTCSGFFTESVIRANCVDLSAQRLISNQGNARAVLINSGQANACTGQRGSEDNLKATKVLADLLGLNPEEVLICSTGVIGEPIPIEKLLKSLKPLVKALSPSGGGNAANAILTTDLRKKEIALQGYLGDRCVRIGGIAKGSGMIHPNMATMLGFLTCDVRIPKDIWHAMLKRVVTCSFNSITVDGDTSTNDSFLAFSAGEHLADNYFDDLEDGLLLACQFLAKSIARDGEGANCLIEVEVQGTLSDLDARRIARTIASSSLVKTAINGDDPNWGRIIAAAGRAGVMFPLESVSLWIGPYKLMNAGEPIDFDRLEVSCYIKEKKNRDYLVGDKVKIKLIIDQYKGFGVSWGCDLSDQYVRINADYTT